MTTYTTPLGTMDVYSPDGGLGPEVQTDRDRPPTGTFIFGPAYDGTCFIIKDNLLYYCKPKQPEAWPSLYYIEVGPKQLPGKTGVFHSGQPHYLNESEIWYIQGTGNGLFQPIPTNAKTGAQSIRGAVSVAGQGIYHTGKDGIYLYANQTDIKITEDTLEPIFRGDSVQDMVGLDTFDDSWLYTRQNYVYFGYRGANDTYPSNVIVFNLNTNRIAYYVYNDGSDIQISAITKDDVNKCLCIGDTTGFIRSIEKPTHEDDDGTAISWEVQSKDYTLQTRCHFPRWVKYDVDAASATTASGKLILDGAVHHTHTLSQARKTRRRLVDEGNGNRAAVRITGTGPVEIYSAEFE